MNTNNKLALICLALVEFIYNIFKLIFLFIAFIVKRIFGVGEKIVVNVLTIVIIIFILLFFSDEIINFIIN